MSDDDFVQSALRIDRSPPVGNSKSTDDNRWRLHTKIANTSAEPIPVTNMGSGAATTPKITNVPVLIADTEQSYAFVTNVRRFSIRSRVAARVQIAYNSGESATNFFTIKPGNIYDEKDIIMLAGVIYFQSSKPTTLEVLEWS